MKRKYDIINIAYEYGYITKINALKTINIHKYGRLKCEFCNKNMSKISIDHIIPKSKKGSNELINLRLIHAHCNNKRGNKLSFIDIIKLLI